METKVCHVIKLSEKLNSRLLVQEEHGFQKGGTLCPPTPWPQELKKSLAWIGLKGKICVQHQYLIFKPKREIAAKVSP